MNKVLVTGGLGVIGSFVCRALLETSRQPVIYNAGGDLRLVRDIASDCIIERGDICDLPRLMGVLRQYDPVAIAHLAGHVGRRVEQFPWSSLSANLVGTTTVFEAARLSGIQRIVFASSNQVYGDVAEKHRHPTYEPVPEEHPLQPINLYGKLKRMCEDIAAHYAQLYGLGIVALRFGPGFAPGRLGRGYKVSPVPAMIEAAIADRPFRLEYGGEQRDDLCYSGESANGFIVAINGEARCGKFDAYNITSGELITVREMVTVLRDLYPSWRGEVGPGLDYRDRGLGNYFRMATQKAQAELGFKPLFDFRRAVIDYAKTMELLKLGFV